MYTLDKKQIRLNWEKSNNPVKRKTKIRARLVFDPEVSFNEAAEAWRKELMI